MTTFPFDAPTPITSTRPSTPQTQGTTTTSRRISPTTIGNGNGATQGAQTEASPAPDAFLTRMDELAQVILDGPQVAWAIEQGMSAPDIASWCGIRQGSDAYRLLECRVEARSRGR